MNPGQLQRWQRNRYEARHTRAKALVKDDFLRKSLLLIALTVLAWFFLTFEVHGAVRAPVVNAPAAEEVACDACVFEGRADVDAGSVHICFKNTGAPATSSVL